MKLLLDANISWRLAIKLSAFFEDCRHVDNIGLPIPPADTTIWNYALVHDCIIVTNDDDFINLLNVKGFSPKVVLLKTGNQSTNYIAEVLIKHIPDIELLYRSEEYGLLEIY
jgi:predicted nuclease of predicted toxin-antitoxin system